MRLCIYLLFLSAFILTPARYVQADPPSGRLMGYASGAIATDAKASLLRGINLGDAMEAPREGQWGWKLSPAVFRVVKQAGFDHVRVPMRISAHAGTEPPYEISGAFLARMDWVVSQALDRDLAVIVDMHHYEELMKQPRAHADRLVALWKQIATRYRNLPQAVVFEILNEPSGNLTADEWNPILARVINAIHQIDKERLLIIEGANWASAKDLRDTLVPVSGDRNLIASFHLYENHYFTHQGASWMRPEFGTRGIIFPGPPEKPVAPVAAALAHPTARDLLRRYNTEPAETNPIGPSTIVAQLDMANDFARRTGLRVYLGEFGAIIQADMASRVRWTRFVRSEAEKRGFGWAYWDFCRNFAARQGCGAEGKWVEEIRAALMD